MIFREQGTRIKEQGSRVKGKVSLFISIDRGLRVEAFGVAGAELFDVHGEDGFEVIADGMGTLGQVPGDIAQLFGERIAVQGMSLGKVLFDEVDGLARLTAQSHDAVDEDVFFGQGGVECAQGQLLVFVDGHVLSDRIALIIIQFDRRRGRT